MNAASVGQRKVLAGDSIAGPPVPATSSAPTAATVDVLEKKPLPPEKLGMLQTIVERANAPQRSQIALDMFTSSLELTDDLAKHVGVLVWAAGTTRDLPDTEGLVPPASGYLALKAVAAMTPPLRAEVERILAAAESPGERAVILKAIGANGANYEPKKLIAALEAFAAVIRGRDLLWLIRETTAYDIEGDIGERQAFTTSCGPTVAITLGAEADPMLDLKLEMDQQRGNASLAATMQREMLEKNGGVAVAYGDRSRQGEAAPIGDLLSQAVMHSGISYTGMSWADLPAERRTQLLDELETMVRRGADIALLSHDGIGGGHYEALVDCSKVQGKRVWRIQDPEGGTRWVSDKSMASADINAGPGLSLTTIWFPA